MKTKMPYCPSEGTRDLFLITEKHLKMIRNDVSSSCIVVLVSLRSLQCNKATSGSKKKSLWENDVLHPKDESPRFYFSSCDMSCSILYCC